MQHLGRGLVAAAGQVEPDQGVGIEDAQRIPALGERLTDPFAAAVPTKKIFCPSIKVTWRGKSASNSCPILPLPGAWNRVA